jgi:hypothetical protein
VREVPARVQLEAAKAARKGGDVRKTRGLILCSVLAAGSSCGRPQQIAPELLPYFRIIEPVAAKTGVVFSGGDIAFEVRDDLAADGRCTGTNAGDKTIQVRRAFWEKANADAKELLAIHELGHCLLGRDHPPDPRKDYDVANKRFYTMMSIRIGSVEYKRNKPFYLNELCTPQPQKVYVTPGS